VPNRLLTLQSGGVKRGYLHHPQGVNGRQMALVPLAFFCFDASS
jgi:hypothetical protein